MAHDIKSPGVSVQVIDQTAFAAVTQGTLAACVGFAERGPVGEPTLILSKESFIETFGEPIADQPYMGMFADKFLDVSTSYFTRIAKAADYEAVTGTVAPTFTAFPALGVMWVELAGFPGVNNGLFRVALASSPTDLDSLITAINTAFLGITLPDGSTALSSYLTADSDSTDTYLVIKADNYRNVTITIRADEGASNMVGITANTIGIADGATSTDVNNYRYAYVRVPVNEVAATAASITSLSNPAATDLNKISAFNLVNIKIDGTSGNPYKLFEDVDITPATGAPATFPTLAALLAPVANDWTGQTFTITLGGFYHMDTGDVVNTAWTVTLTFDNDPVDLPNFIIALNAALTAATGGTGTLSDYIEFAAQTADPTKIEIRNAGTWLNYGSQCSITVADGTGTIANLGFATGTNDTASGGDTTYNAAGVAAAIASGISGGTASSSAGNISISSSRLGTTSFVEILNATTTTENALGAGRTFDGVFTTGLNDTGSNASNSGVLNFVAVDAGTWGDDFKVRTYTATNPVTAATLYYVEVFKGDDSVELLGPVPYSTGTIADFYVAYKAAVNASSYVVLEYGETIEYPNTDTGTAPTALPPVSGTPNPDYWELDGGDNGIPASSTEIDALVVNALDEYSDREQYIIDLLLAPGFTGNGVVAKLQSVAEVRKDILALVDSPAFLTYTQAINWHNGNYPTSGGSTALSSAYAVYTWDWQRDFDAYNEQYIDLPASIYEAVAIASTQSNYELWEAPAGPERGVVGSISSYSKPSQAEREYLYNDVDPACVNPIVQFPTEGIMIYGQKTCLKINKAQNRINVTRLVSHVKRNVERIGRGYIFKLSNPTTWANLSRELTAFLANIQDRGGLTSYTVICDATTNTTDRIDAGIMYAKIFIQPTRVAERIFIDLTIQQTGAEVTAV